MNSLPYPHSRIETYLAVAAGMTGLALPKDGPQGMTEMLLAKIIGEDVYIPTPLEGRKNVWLGYIAGIVPEHVPHVTGAVLIGRQMVRVLYLAKAAGLDVELPLDGPRNTAERYFAAIADSRPPGAILRVSRGLNIALTDVASGIESLDKLYGDTTQQTYSGKNMLPYPYYGAINGTGITFVANSDGTIVLNGQNNGDKNCTYMLFSNSEKPIVLSPGTYYFIPPTNAATIEYMMVDTGGQYLSFGPNRYSRTFNSEISIKQIYVQVLKTDTTTFSDTKIYPMLTNLSGQTETNYEPYTGGYASPNPMYPQEVQTVTGRQVVEVSGKNLFRVPESKTDRGITLTKNADGTFDLTGTATAQVDINITYPIPSTIKPDGATSYATTMKTNATITDAFAFYIEYFINGAWSASANQLSSGFPNPRTMSKTPVSGVNQLRTTIRVFSGKTIDLHNVQVQCELGSAATDFEPYTAPAKYEINLGKNLFNPNISITTQIGNYVLTKSVIQNGIRLTFDSAVTGYTAAIFIVGKVPDYLGKTINFTSTAVPSANNTVRAYLGTCNSAGNNRVVKSDYSGGTDVRLSWTVEQDSNEYICLALYGTATGAVDSGDYMDYTNPQLEVGPVATEFQPYFTPIELCKIGNKQDYIYQNNGEWYLHREVRHLSLSVADMNNNSSYPGWINQTILREDIGSYNSPLLSRTKWTSNLNDGSYNQQYDASAVSANTRNGTGTVYMSKTYFNNVYGGDWTQDYWKTTFPNLVFDLYYGIINVPDDELITNSALVAQLNALSNAVLPKPSANLVVSGNLAGEIEISYWGKE